MKYLFFLICFFFIDHTYNIFVFSGLITFFFLRKTKKENKRKMEGIGFDNFRERSGKKKKKKKKMESRKRDERWDGIYNYNFQILYI